jgi:hypothetical protein
MSTTVAPERILSDLSKLWVDLAREGGDTGSGVLRACTMTLLVACGEADDAQAIGEIVARLMPQHPSRAIVVRVTPSREWALDVRVFAQCWTPFGERRHICAEEIEITSSETALGDVPPVVLPLPVADLPVVLWCRDLRLMDLPGFRGIASLAGRIVLDGAKFDLIQAILAGGQSAGDLAWTRITHWRELIARIFENRGLACLDRFSEVKVKWTGPSALYMAAWLMDGLRRAGANPRLEIDSSSTPERHVELVSPELHVVVSQSESRCAEVRINDAVSQTMLPEASEYSLMREELSIAGHDPVFERVLPAAARLAVSS